MALDMIYLTEFYASASHSMESVAVSHWLSAQFL